MNEQPESPNPADQPAPAEEKPAIDGAAPTPPAITNIKMKRVVHVIPGLGNRMHYTNIDNADYLGHVEFGSSDVRLVPLMLRDAADQVEKSIEEMQKALRMQQLQKAVKSGAITPEAARILAAQGLLPDPPNGEKPS